MHTNPAEIRMQSLLISGQHAGSMHMQVTVLGQHDDEKGHTCNAAIPRLCALGPAPLPHAHGRGQHPAFPVVRLQNVFHTACGNAHSACHSPYSLSLKMQQGNYAGMRDMRGLQSSGGGLSMHFYPECKL